jgi:hypothetical protein
MASMLRKLFHRQTLSTTLTWFRTLSLTPVHHGQPPPEVFRGSNWQPADTIRTDDHSDPIGAPDDWDKYNRIVYPPTAPGEVARTGVNIYKEMIYLFVLTIRLCYSMFIIVERIFEEILRNIGFLLKW